jgi:hypothetical protein
MLQDFATIAQWVATNNKSKNHSNELIVALIWKESGFDDASKSAKSTATGLTQMTIPAVDDVNRNTPPDTHFAFSDMLDGQKNIQCGTYYLDMIYHRAGDDLTAGLNRFGTGAGYATNILAAETCLQSAKGSNNVIDPTLAKACLFKIHT